MRVFEYEFSAARPNGVMGKNMNDAVIQVVDDPGLLQEMLDDLRQAPQIFQPTNYWKVYEESFVPELEALGLHDFRSRRDSVLQSFGATDLSSAPLRSLRCLDVLPGPWRRSVQERVRRSSPYRRRRATTFKGFYEEAESFGQACGARPLAAYGESLAGGPEEYYVIDGRTHTYWGLYAYMQYAWCCRHIDFGGVRTYVELGPGLGRVVEVIKKLHPDIRFLLFDLAPQLYVCNQYLQTVFPDSTIAYREAKGLSDLGSVPAGSICILGTLRFPLLTETPSDLFWNSASFQEMEPHVVEHYLQSVSRSARHIYLRQQLLGQLQAPCAGEVGVLRKTKFVHYVNLLRDYELTDLVPSWCNTVGELQAHMHDYNYYDSFWTKHSPSACDDDRPVGDDPRRAPYGEIL